MKTINKYLLLLATAVFTLTACEKNVERDPSPVAPTTSAAFKSPAVEVDINPNKEALAYDVTLVRSTTADALTVGIEVIEGDVDVIVVPATASFEKDAAETTLKLTFPEAKLDSSYSIVIAIKEDNMNPYIDGAANFLFKVNIATWEQSETPAVFVDGVVCSPFGMDPIAWYVPFMYKLNASDGSKDYRFLNPYRQNKGIEDPDQYGVYSWFVYNSGEEVDMDNTYNWEIHVDANGQATCGKVYLGPDYSYGPACAWMTADFYAKKTGTDPDYAQYGAGSYVAAADAILFPEGTLLWYFDGYGGNLTSLSQIIYLDSKAYQDDHIIINDFNEDVEWEEVESVVNQFESTIFNFISEDQKLYKAIDPFEGNPKSPYINLYCLKDVYAEGGNLAFYWDGEDGEITVPNDQNTKLQFMKEDLYIAEGSGAVATSNVKGTDVKVFTFDLVIVSESGNEVGEFTETFSIADEAIVFAKEDFIGDFTMAGYSQFTGNAETVDVAIAEVEGKIILSGLQYCSGVVCEFDDATGTLSFAPQAQDSVYGAYDITLYTTTAKGESTTAACEFGFSLSGVASLTATSEADGYLVYSKAAGGWLAGHYGLSLIPATDEPATAPAKAPNGTFDLKKHTFKAGNTPSVEHLSFKGKYQRRLHATVAF